MGCKISKSSTEREGVTLPKSRKNKKGIQIPKNKICIKEVLINQKNQEEKEKNSEKSLRPKSEIFTPMSSSRSNMINYSKEFSVDYYKKREEKLRYFKEKLENENIKEKLVKKDELILMSSRVKSEILKENMTMKMMEIGSFDESTGSIEQNKNSQVSRSLGSFFHSESSITVNFGSDRILDGEIETQKNPILKEKGEYFVILKDFKKKDLENSFESLGSLNDMIA